jgi:hypothetical protein
MDETNAASTADFKVITTSGYHVRNGWIFEEKIIVTVVSWPLIRN